MGHDTFIEVQKRLLSLYRSAATATEPLQPTELHWELTEIRSLVRDRGAKGAFDTYQRFLTLIGKRVPAIANDPTLALYQSDLAAPAPTVPEESPRTRAEPGAATPAAKPLPRIAATGRPGITLVTCCMNRNDNLCKALQSWLPHGYIDEIVIVDWSSETPVRKELASRGIEDRRIRVIRVNGEPRWILSYAFNAGFRGAQYNQILKVDADIVLSSDFFSANRLEERGFIAGNWRTAKENQTYVNGFFFAPRAAIHAVGGFNEYITTYGWDDDDIYHRMTAAGFVRQDVAAGTVHHLDHSDEDRLGDAAYLRKTRSALDTIMADTLYKIRRNRYLANVMPYWSEKSHHAVFAIEEQHQGGLDIRREQWVPSQVPPHINSQADYIALWEIASWRYGPRIRWLQESALRRLLVKPLGTITKLDIELSIANPQRLVDPAAKHLVVCIPKLPAILTNAAQISALVARLERLSDRLREVGRVLVIQAPITFWPGNSQKSLSEYLLVPTESDIGQPQTIPWAQVNSAAQTPEMELWSELDQADLEKRTSVAAAVQVPRAKIFIDVQHGLGNRLRAMASAAAIAQATDRELVVVWQPDHHCEGRIYDLIEYEGAVEEEAFLADASHKGCKIYNYMEAEEASLKGEPIDLAYAGDIYARAAYTLNATPSTWERENQFLKQLKPVRTVRDMVASVRKPNDVSAHVRMVGGTEYEHLAYESMANWTAEGHAKIDYWRKQSHFSRFMKHIDTLIKEGKGSRIFLAADTPETYAAFVQTYGDRVTYLERDLYDRSAEQLRYALADALLLGMSPLLLGSTWSSFSELALRLSAHNPKLEMSGNDF